MSTGGRFSSSLVASDAMGMYQAMLDHLPVGWSFLTVSFA
jgi:hypothetical protein